MVIGAKVVSVFLLSGLITLNVPSRVSTSRARNAPVAFLQAPAQKNPNNAKGAAGSHPTRPHPHHLFRSGTKAHQPAFGDESARGWKHAEPTAEIIFFFIPSGARETLWLRMHLKVLIFLIRPIVWHRHSCCAFSPEIFVAVGSPRYASGLRG